jgi:NADH:ubiquinone oxidoreductase subunit 5 (subunit L)/multisubunit Na+/H+ antiporter MnhA subunit
MPTDCFALIALPPLLVTCCLGTGIVSGLIAGEAGERITARFALGGAILSWLLALSALLVKTNAGFADQLVLGTWLHSGDYHVDLSFRLDYLGSIMALLVSTLGLLTLKFSVDYMHREPGFHRFFLVMTLFVGAMLLLVTAGNAVLTFVGWELAGVCSYLLIAYAYDRPNAAAGATRAFVTNRIGDAGFMLGIFLCQIWFGSVEWDSIVKAALRLSDWQVGMLAGCFLLAAMAKSGQVPFAPWLARAIEGPTPSSAIFYGAIMVHAGVYLILRLEPVFSQSPVSMVLMMVVGALTAFYGWYGGLTQTDVKSALIFSTSAQIGLMFVEAGLGWWQLAQWHLVAHACVRAYQFLSAPSLMHQLQGIQPRAVPSWLGRVRFLYLASLQRLWLETLGDRIAVHPIQEIAADLQAFDAQFVDPAFGTPAGQLQALEMSEPTRHVLHASGLAGSLLLKTANGLHWFEERLVLQGLGENLVRTGRHWGVRLNYLEDLLGRPRYLIAFILITLMLAA